MKTLLITGASGFFGSAILKQMSEVKDYRIVAVTSGRKKDGFPAYVETETANLLSETEQLIERVQPDMLLHLAWGKQDGASRNSDSNIRWLEASFSLLRAFIDHGGKRFVFAGTSSEYEDVSGLHQEKPGNIPMSMYGETKKAFSDVAKNYCRRVGVEFVDVRFFTLYGENDQHEQGAIPMCIRTLMKNEPFICKAPNTIRDYVYVEDAAKAVLRILSSNYTGSVNVSSCQPRTMREVFSFIADELGKKELLSFENTDKCDLILAGDNRILLDEIGFDAFTDFEDGMRKTVQWWKQRTF